MFVFEGNTSTSASSTPKNIPMTIKSIKLVNKTGGAITVNASILYGSTNIWITPYNHPLNANEAYESNIEVRVRAEAIIYVLVSGDCDYYFSVE